MDRRDNFLLEMYNQMWGNINRHIVVVWKSATLLASSLALVGVAEKELIDRNACYVVMILCVWWFISHTIDSNLWFRRNMAIIGNIEKQFLNRNDGENISYYTVIPHQKFKSKNFFLADHFLIQVMFAIALSAVLMTFHFSLYVWPTLNWNSKIDFMLCSPYATFIIATILLVLHWIKNKNSYSTFIEKSPGMPMEEG